MPTLKEIVFGSSHKENIIPSQTISAPIIHAQTIGYDSTHINIPSNGVGYIGDSGIYPEYTLSSITSGQSNLNLQAELTAVKEELAATQMIVEELKRKLIEEQEKMIVI